MGGIGSGRKKKDANTRQIQQTLAEAAVSSAKLIRDYVEGKDRHGNKVSITMVKLTACLQAIAHTIGTPRQRVDYTRTGDDLTLKDLAELAEEFDKSVSEVIQEAIQDPIHAATIADTHTPKVSKN